MTEINPADMTEEERGAMVDEVSVAMLKAGDQYAEKHGNVLIAVAAAYTLGQILMKDRIVALEEMDNTDAERDDLRRSLGDMQPADTLEVVDPFMDKIIETMCAGVAAWAAANCAKKN